MTTQQQHPVDKANTPPDNQTSHDSTRPPVLNGQSDAGNSDGRGTDRRLVKALTNLAADLATTSDLDRLCSLISDQAAALVGADEAAVYLKTRPLSTDDSTLQLTLPLRVRGEVLGVLTVARQRPEGTEPDLPSPIAFSEEDKRRLTLLTSMAAIAIVGIKREQATRRRSDWRDRALDLLQETGRVMGSTLELMPLMRRIIDVTVRALRAEAGMLALLDSNDQLILRAVTGAIPRDIIGKRLDASQSLIGWVTRHGRSALVPDSSADPRASFSHPADSMGFVARALLVAPLVTKGQTIGAIEVANRHEGAFDEGDRYLLEALALSAAAAIENARMYEHLQRQALQQENIIRVGHAMSSAQAVDAVFQEVVESALAVIPAAFTAVVHLLDEEQGGLRLHCDAGRPLWNVMKQPFSIGEGIAGYVFATRELANVDDVLTNPRYILGPGRVVYRSLLVAPLIVEDKPLGTLSVTGLEPDAFGPEDEQMMRGLAAQAAVALRNARLLDSLRESEARYRGLVENVNALLLIADASGTIIFAGGRWSEMMGYTPAEVVGLPYQQFCHPQDLSALNEHLSQLATTPCKVPNLFYRALHKDGAVRWHQVSAVSTANERGQVERIYTVIHDVTTRIKAEQAIARHSDQLAALRTIAASDSRNLEIDDIVQGGLQKLMDALDLDVGGLVLINPELDQMVPQTIIGLSSEFLDFVTPLQSTERFQALRTREPILIPDLMSEPRFARHPDLLEMIEHERLHSLAAVPVVAQDEVIGALFVANRTQEVISPGILDLLVIVGQQFGVVLHNAQLYAEAEERAAQLQVAYRQLQDLARRKTQFVQNTSHELRTPLTFVRGYLELLLSGDLGPLTEEQRGVLEIMEIKSQRLVDMVNDIAILLEVELSPADVEPVDLVDAVARSVMNQSEQAASVGIKLKTEWPPTLPIVQGNRHRLTQVFDHLLENAIKFSPDGGQILVRAWSEQGNAFVRVTDQGIGIPPNEQERIFDRFYQVDGSTTRRFGGTGLGLAIVKETIEAHGGTVQVQSSGVEGKGTSFTVSIPLIQDNPKENDNREQKAKPRGA